MSLLRQLTIIFVCLFLLLFAGTFAINVHNARDYLSSQLQTISQDMATSLGLTLSPHMAADELVIVESLVNSVFNSGYYRELVVTDVNGKTLVERIQPLSEIEVPEWFVKMVRLETPSGEALIMSGRQKAGTIRISASPGDAYATLWSSAIHDLFMFLGMLVVVLGLGVLALYYVLRPLRALETQAKAICEREYPVQTHLPWTRELRSVVEAMNLMALKVKDMFSEQEETLGRLRNDAYRDALTGLANRSYFEMQVRHLIEAEGEFEGGALVFLEVSNIKAINDRLGFQTGDALLRGVGDLIQNKFARSDIAEGFAARLTGACFAIVLVGMADAAAQDFVADLSYALPELQHKGLVDTVEIGHIGLAMYRGQSFSQLLSEADMALRAAQIKGINAIHQHDPHAIGKFGALTATQWIALLRRIVEQAQHTLLLQPSLCASESSEILHQEVLLRIAGDDSKLIPASIFIPMVHRHGLTQAYDKMVISEVLSRLKEEDANASTVAINLLPTSIGDPEFVEWAYAELHAHPELAVRIRFELSDYAVTQNLSAVQAWVRRMAPTGVKMGVDRFGKGFNAINYLNTLKIEYIKIDGSLIRGIDRNKDNQSLVASLVNIAHGRDILVIAESVETAEELAMVRSLRVDGVQGYGVQRPVVWEV